MGKTTGRALIAVGLWAGTACGAPPLNGQEHWLLKLRVDNDFFVGFSPTQSSDEEYTQGTVMTLEGLRPLDLCGEDRRPQLSAAQYLFTPRDESPGATGQRRHAAWLRLGVGCVSDGRGTSMGLMSGLVGPEAGGAAAQRVIHRWFGFREPIGWASQLPTRIDMAAWVSRDAEITAIGPVFRLGLRGRAEVGTIRSAGTLSLETRVDFRDVLSVVAEAGVTVSAFDYLLTGVEPRLAVPWMSLGGELALNRIVLTYSVTHRAPMYEEEPRGFTYGSLSLSVLW